MPIKKQIENILNSNGVDIIRYVDISELPKSQNKGYSCAILIGTTLSPQYLKKVGNDPDYVENMKRDKRVVYDEFHNAEIKTDNLADLVAELLNSKGISAYSQSEKNVLSTGYYDENNKSTPLPHKTIAVLASMGWIGKHNLLVSPEFGSAISMCTVLTNLEVEYENNEILKSKCGSCKVCEEICDVNAIKGLEWCPNIARDKIVDVHVCTTCIKCLVNCPWTIRYVNKKLK